MIKLFIDGASAGNPGPAGAGVFVKKNDGEVERYSIPLGQATNHEAEFYALIEGLKLCVANQWHVVSFSTDSKLVDESFEKRYTKKSEYQDLLEEALQLSDQLDLCFVKWIPSTKNKAADQLSKEAVSKSKGNK
nr:reverse transcriptase-like protein [Bacillus sp. FJAT-44742]